MPRFLIDADTAAALRQQCLGGRAWAGLLVGRRDPATVTILGHVLLPPRLQTSHAIAIESAHVDLLDRLLNGLEVVGPLIAGPVLPEREDIERFCAHWRAVRPAGALLYAVGNDHVLSCFDVATGAAASLRSQNA